MLMMRSNLIFKANSRSVGPRTEEPRTYGSACAQSISDDQSDMLVWDRVSDPVGRPEGPLDLLATSQRTGILPFQIHGYSDSVFTIPVRTGF